MLTTGLFCSRRCDGNTIQNQGVSLLLSPVNDCDALQELLSESTRAQLIMDDQLDHVTVIATMTDDINVTETIKNLAEVWPSLTGLQASAHHHRAPTVGLLGYCGAVRQG